MQPPLFGLGARASSPQRVFWQRGVSAGRLGGGVETRRSLVPELGKERGGRSYRRGSSVRQRGHIHTLLPVASKPQPLPQNPNKTPHGMCLGGGVGGWIRLQIPQRAGARRCAAHPLVRCSGAGAEQQRAGCCPGPPNPTAPRARGTSRLGEGTPCFCGLTAEILLPWSLLQLLQ